MQIVSRFEAALLRLLQYFLRGEPIERATPLIEARVSPPKELSEGAMRLIRDALAKRCTFLLAQRGGWRDERFLRNDKPKAGRLWQRTAPVDLGLSFSQETLNFLVWITSVRPGDKSPVWAPEHDRLTHGDLLLLFFAHEGLRETSETLGALELRKRAPYNEHALCWLAYPEDFVRTPAEAYPRFQPWMSGVGSCILEALQPDLTQRWVLIESSKERIEKPETMRLLGSAQDRILAAFLPACEQANRRDLARFLLRAAHQLLGPNAHAGMWTGALQMTGQRLADRAATYQAATSLLRHLDHLASWAKWARSQG
ncbi:MAG: hypothetical protein SNJ82_12555, partial [Gemmataceae bacterium]